MKTIFRYLHIFYLKIRAEFRPQLNLNGISLFIAPHPDDEALGCGGLISHLCNECNPPHVIIMTGGGGSHTSGSDAISSEEIIRERRRLTLNSAKKLGLPEDNIHFLDFIDGHISEKPEKERIRLQKLIEDIQPDNIFIPHSGEGWPDHISTREILLSLLGVSSEKCLVDNNSTLYSKHSTPTEFKNPQIFEYCVWMWYYNVWNLDWKNAYKFRMSKPEHEAKLHAVNAYIKPHAPNGKPWSGVLPKPFIKANSSKTELYFEVSI